MSRWKYQKQRNKSSRDTYIYLKPDEAKKLKITAWEFTKNLDGPKFRCAVIEEDGEEVDKFWYVWDFDLKEALKAKLKGKKADMDKVEVTVTRSVEDMEEVFELQ